MSSGGSTEATFLSLVCSLTLPDVTQSLDPSRSSLYHIWGYLRIRDLCASNSSSGMFLPVPSSLIPKSVSSARRPLLQKVLVTIAHERTWWSWLEGWIWRDQPMWFTRVLGKRVKLMSPHYKLCNFLREQLRLPSPEIS